MKQWEIFPVVTPLLLHFFVSQAVVMVLGKHCDAAELTAITAVILTPITIFWYHIEIRKYQDREQNPVEVGKIILTIVGGIAVSQALTMLLNGIGVTRHFSNETQEALFRGKLFVQILGSGMFVPITEELLFRGLTYQRIKRIAGTGWAVILSSLLFAVYHGNFVQMLYAFPMALLLCVAYEKCDSIKGAIALHMAANLTAVIVSYFG